MSKKEKKVVNGVEIEVDPELGAVMEDDEEAGVDQEKETEETEEALDDSESDEIDWKEARTILKKADSECGYTIDDYAKRSVIDGLKMRYNAKERTLELYNEIMSLEG